MTRRLLTAALIAGAAGTLIGVAPAATAAVPTGPHYTHVGPVTGPIHFRPISGVPACPAPHTMYPMNVAIPQPIRQLPNPCLHRPIPGPVHPPISHPVGPIRYPVTAAH